MSIPDDDHPAKLGAAGGSSSSSGPGLRDSKGWDGKLRVARTSAGFDLSRDDSAPEDSDREDKELPGEIIDADEDLLDDYELDTDDIDLVHRGISSIPALRLERFTKVERLCLRQNRISRIDFPSAFGQSLKDLDLYDNSIAHTRNLEQFPNLTSLDLSFNRLKHIKNVTHLAHLRDLYFVQNKIAKIENLEGLTSLRNLELGANRIREIENLDTLTGLEQLWLGKNKIAQLQNLAPLTNLRILSIQANRLTTLAPALATLPALEELYVSHNALTSLAGLEASRRLRVLDVSNNRVEKFEVLRQLAQLEEFWASQNALSSFEELEAEMGGLEHLETVYLEGNPLQTSNRVTYRNKVRLALPKIKQIDATFVQVS